MINIQDYPTANFISEIDEKPHIVARKPYQQHSWDYGHFAKTGEYDELWRLRTRGEIRTQNITDPQTRETVIVARRVRSIV